MADYNPNQFDREALQGIALDRPKEPEDKRLDMLRQLIDVERAADHAKTRYKETQAAFREVSEEIDKLRAVQAELRRDLGLALGFSDGSENVAAAEVTR